MKLFIISDIRLIATPDGVWSGGNGNNEFWQRYLNVFDGVEVVARVKEAQVVPPGWKRVEGAGVGVRRLPDFLGPSALLKSLPDTVNAIRSIDTSKSAVLLRVPSTVALLFGTLGIHRQQPFAVEVIGDPWEVFAPGAIHHPLRPLLRQVAAQRLRAQCAKAMAVSYESSMVLPERYPAPASSVVSICSSIELAETHFVKSPRVFTPDTPKRIVTVASLSQPYKGIDVLLKALAEIVISSPSVRLDILGDGRMRSHFEDMANQLNVTEHVRFLGHVPAGDPVRNHLDESSLFVLPSRTEGLPRAMIEAMARGLPCIGTSVGGIPELLSPENLVARDDARALGDRILTVFADPGLMTQMSARNLKVAQRYRSDILQKRRSEFYGAVRRRTESWLRR